MDVKLKVTVLVDDAKNPLEPELQAQHGLSLYLEVRNGKEETIVLMDAGPSSEIILHNVDAMGVDLKKIKAIFLSHGHYDHVNGLIGVLKRIDEPIPVIAHPKVFSSKFVYRPHIKYAGPSFRQQAIEATGGLLLLATNPVQLAKGIMSSGEVERGTAFEEVEGFWKVEDELFIQDAILDDQSLIVNIGAKRLVVIAGCAHSGIINTIRQAQRITGVNRVYAVLGGFHLKDVDEKRIEKTIEELLRINPNIIAPCHCTGSKAVKRLTETFHECCRPLRVGEILEIY